MYGNYTRYGDVKPLLDAADNEYAILRHGDELMLEFGDVPKEGDNDRYAFLLADVMYSVKYSVKGFVNDTIEPLPFHGMSSYPYPANESYPYDAEHLQYISEYNTRQYAGGGSSGMHSNITISNSYITGSARGIYMTAEDLSRIINTIRTTSTSTIIVPCSKNRDNARAQSVVKHRLKC